MKLDLGFIVRFILLALAIYRIAYILTRESAPYALATRLRAFLGKKAAGAPEGGFHWTMAELFNCPHCIGFWLALFAWPLLVWTTLPGDVVIVILALAGMQSFLTDIGEKA